MAKKHLISAGRWHISTINKLKSWQEKLVFEYLISNPMTSRSGIYTVYSGGISEGLGSHLISAEEVRATLRKLEEKALIKYEHDLDIVYIINFHKYVPFGSGKPIIIASDLLSDFEEFNINSITLAFWQDYIAKNSDKLIKLEDKLCRPGNKGNPDKITIRSLLNLLNN